MEKFLTPLSLDDEANVLRTVDAAREQVNRILASDTFRNSESVRRLFRFVADKTFAGEADQLKEYSIGVDALGKPPTYDPRQDAGVRLVASRLRVKLDEYYRKEGSADPLIIKMPRGRFKITWEPHAPSDFPATRTSTGSPEQPRPTSVGAEPAALKKWRALVIGLFVLTLALTVIVVRSLPQISRFRLQSPITWRSAPELEAIWGPFISSPNQVVMAYWNPVFVRFRRNGDPDVLFRKSGGTGDWDYTVNSQEFSALKRTLGNPSAQPTLNYTMRGSLVSIFALSQFFAHHRSDVSLVRLDELSWQEVADNNVVLVAPSGQIYRRQQALPVSPAFIADQTGVHNLRPLPGEPSVFEDSKDHQQSDGETVELISMIPGPLGRTRVVSFAGNHAAGMIGGVQSFTDPSFARMLTQKLRNSSGQIPQYFQVVLKIRYRDDTPTSTSYLAHRALALEQNAASH